MLILYFFKKRSVFLILSKKDPVIYHSLVQRETPRGYHWVKGGKAIGIDVITGML